MRDLIDRFGPYWSKHLSYNFHMAMFYRVCYTVLTDFGARSVFYLAFTDKERITPIAYGRRLDDFDLYMDKAELYFVKTTPSRYRLYIETMFCKTYGELKSRFDDELEKLNKIQEAINNKLDKGKQIDIFIKKLQ